MRIVSSVSILSPKRAGRGYGRPSPWGIGHSRDSLFHPRRGLVLPVGKLLRPNRHLLLVADPLPVGDGDGVRAGDRFVALVEANASDDPLVIHLLERRHEGVPIDRLRGLGRDLDEVHRIIRPGPRVEGRLTVALLELAPEGER